LVLQGQPPRVYVPVASPGFLCEGSTTLRENNLGPTEKYYEIRAIKVTKLVGYSRVKAGTTSTISFSSIEPEEK